MRMPFRKDHEGMRIIYNGRRFHLFMYRHRLPCFRRMRITSNMVGCNCIDRLVIDLAWFRFTFKFGDDNSKYWEPSY